MRRTRQIAWVTLHWVAAVTALVYLSFGTRDTDTPASPDALAVHLLVGLFAIVLILSAFIPMVASGNWFGWLGRHGRHGPPPVTLGLRAGIGVVTFTVAAKALSLGDLLFLTTFGLVLGVACGTGWLVRRRRVKRRQLATP